MLGGMFGLPGPLLLFAVITAVATFGAVVGAIYLRAGGAGLRRQIPQLGLLALLLAAGSIAVPWVDLRLGDRAGLVLGAAALGLNFLARSRRRAAAAKAPPPASPPALRMLISVWVVVMVVNLAILVFLSARSA